MMSYINETDFVIENKQLVYPEVITDGLQLYYDAKGKRDTDYHRDTMLDMSGNKNHGKLNNFAYEKHSGYKDGLVFDYIDDKLVRPALNLQPNDLTFMLNGNIISFSPDGTVKRVQDGEVIESKGFNLVKNGDFVDGTSRWVILNNASVKQTTDGVEITSTKNSLQIYQSVPDAMVGDVVYTAVSVKSDTPNNYLLSTNQEISYLDRNNTDYQLVSSREKRINGPTMSVNRTNLSDGVLSSIYLKYMVCINLTKTFGAGNEPTKVQMDEIINRFGFIPNAQDLIDRIEYKGNDLGDMENIIDGLYKTEVLSGEEVYTDKADDSVVHVEVDGKSVGGGNNLFNAARYVSENIYASSIYSAEEDGSLTIRRVDGTGQSEYQTIAYLKPDTDYVMSFSDRMNERFEFVNASGNEISINRQWDGYTFKFTTNSTTDRMVGKFYPIKQEYPFNVFVKIEEGSVATEYELPEPSPDYPIDIHSLNDFDVFSSVGKRNIILNSSEPMNGYSQTTGLEASVTTEGYYKVVASEGNGNWFYPQALYAMRFNGQIEKNFNVGDVFTFSVDIKSPDSTDIPSLYALGGIHSYTPLQGEMGAEFSRFYITSTWTNLSSMNLALGLGGRSGTFIFRRMKLEKGPVPTPWTPAQEETVESSNHPSIDKINLLLDEPLRSVGDVKDRLFIDSDGLWKVERKVWEDLIDGSKVLKYPSYPVAGYTKFYYQHLTNSYIQPTSDVLANLLPSLETNLGYSNNGQVGVSIYSSGTGQIIYGTVKTSDLTSDDTDGLVAYFKANSLIVHYQLANPITETLSQSLQDKLNNLRSFEDSNYVYTVLPNEDNHLSENLKPTLHAKFLYNNWYKEDRVINNLMIYSRALTNEEMLQNYKTIKRRWGM